MKQRSFIYLILMGLSLCSYADDVISNILVRQRMPWSRLVDIDYVLVTDESFGVDVEVQIFQGTEPVTVLPESLSGDLQAVCSGMRRIVWDPTRTPGISVKVLTNLEVRLTLVKAPLYMVVDLDKNANDPERLEYVYEADLTNGIWGAWERDPIANLGTPIKSLIWTGVTTNDLYKTDKMVFRRVNPGTFMMGGESGTTETTITRSFYMGVFTLTQAQYKKITGTDPSGFSAAEGSHLRAFCGSRNSYEHLRGTVDGAEWPSGGHAVDTGSLVEKIRTFTGLDMLDLPTEAQWEYACRAGTTTYYNDGLGKPANTDSNEQLNVLGRYKWNGGFIWDPELNSGAGGWKESGHSNTNINQGVAIVGLYKPNAWGVYDMHGNVLEWCLDWYGSDLPGGNDPVGHPDGDIEGDNAFRRLRRGGNTFQHPGSTIYSGARSPNTPDNSSYHNGCRFVINL